MENNIDKNKLKRFGEITILNIDTFIEGSYIKICNEDDYIDSAIVTIDEIISLYTLSLTQNYIFIQTQDNKFTYNNGCFEIESPFAWLKFTRKDFTAFGNYIYGIVEERKENG
ncbi:MAG: hypothetical protein NC181_02860 [Clostridium sp.]|nr:hypothetical protein [Clostridium sp.]MCM1444177.1 hypothetical protein [Candidatus Amulumruptor caecigallinarius]